MAVQLKGQGEARGFGLTTETEPLWLGFGLQWGCRRWKGVLLYHGTTVHGILDGWKWGVRWYGERGW